MPDFPANQQLQMVTIFTKIKRYRGLPHHSLVKKVDHHMYKLLSLQERASDKSGPLHVKRYQGLQG